MPNYVHFDTQILKLTNHSENTVIIPFGTIAAHSLENLNNENKAFETGFNQLFDQIYKIKSNLLVHYESLTSNEKIVHNQELELWKKRREKLVKQVDISKTIDIQYGI